MVPYKPRAEVLRSQIWVRRGLDLRTSLRQHVAVFQGVTVLEDWNGTRNREVPRERLSLVADYFLSIVSAALVVATLSYGLWASISDRAIDGPSSLGVGLGILVGLVVNKRIGAAARASSLSASTAWRETLSILEG